jgi:hypothetical protein
MTTGALRSGVLHPQDIPPALAPGVQELNIAGDNPRFSNVLFPNGVRLVDGAYLDAAEELAILRKNTWKEDVTEARVVSRYVQFLNSWGQGRWDILRVQNA